jgi:hypothetical protein
VIRQLFQTLAAFAMCMTATTTGVHSQISLDAGAAVGASFVARVFDLPEVGDRFTITGADDDGLNVSIFVEARHARMPFLGLRVEGMYNTLSSPPNLYSVSADRARLLRMALRDEVFAVLSSIIARPAGTRALAPHIVVGTGLYHTRLGTNADPGGRDVMETHGAYGVGVNGGFGVQWQNERWRIHLEARWHEVVGSKRGSGFVPLTVGVARSVRSSE